jgi:hypothetical protein
MKYFSFILFIFFNLSCENDRTLFSINNVSYSDVEIFKYIEKDVFESLELTEKEIQLRTLAEDFIFMNEAKILGIDTLKSVQFLMKDKIQNRLLDSLLRQKVVRPMFSANCFALIFVLSTACPFENL